MMAIAGCGSSSSSSHNSGEQACRLLDSYEATYAGYGDELTYLGDALVTKNIAQVRAMADAAKDGPDDLAHDFQQLFVEATSDQGKIFNVDYAADLDHARNHCIAHGYAVRES